MRTAERGRKSGSVSVSMEPAAGVGNNSGAVAVDTTLADQTSSSGRRMAGTPARRSRCCPAAGRREDVDLCSESELLTADGGAGVLPTPAAAPIETETETAFPPRSAVRTRCVGPTPPVRSR